LVLELAEAMTATPADVAEDLRDRLRARFTERQLVELVTAIAWEGFRARFTGPSRSLPRVTARAHTASSPTFTAATSDPTDVASRVVTNKWGVAVLALALGFAAGAIAFGPFDDSGIACGAPLTAALHGKVVAPFQEGTATKLRVLTKQEQKLLNEVRDRKASSASPWAVGFATVGGVPRTRPRTGAGLRCPRRSRGPHGRLRHETVCPS